MVKVWQTAVLIVSALLLGGCLAVRDAEGGELIKAAREKYASLNSARVVMTNTATGEAEQEFVFKYDEKGILTYSYRGKSENSEYAQYNNGAEMFTYENGELSYTHRGEDGFALYTRGATHPQADEGMILYSPSAISDASVSDESGVKHIHHTYDVKKIGAQAESGEVVGFSADYFFSGDELLYFTETTEVSDSGDIKLYCYRVDILDADSISQVENTVKPYEAAN